MRLLINLIDGNGLDLWDVQHYHQSNGDLHVSLDADRVAYIFPKGAWVFLIQINAKEAAE